MVKVHQSAALLFVHPSLVLYTPSGPLSASSDQAIATSPISQLGQRGPLTLIYLNVL